MSKPIRITEQHIVECRADFEKVLKDAKLTDSKLSFVKVFSIDNKRATIYFTGEAWAKMVMLIKEFDKEVAWHGVAHRGENESKDEYIITDIMVYPQTVTGSTVEMDTEAYAIWLMKNAEDERFDNIRMQGHSHVDMGTSPSSVDLNHQGEILNMLGDDDFYIFMIWNKSFASTNKIYDLKKNILFEDKDITVKIMGAAEDFDAFINDAKKMVKPKTCAVQNYSGNYGRGYQNNTPVATLYNSVLSESSKPEKTNNKEDKENKKKGKPRTRIEVTPSEKARQQSVFDMYEEDDDLCDTYYRGY